MPPSFLWQWIVILDQNTQRGPVEIVELPRAGRPEKGCKPGQSEREGDRDQHNEPGHVAAPRSLSALATTIKDDPDMASAAISGVTCPAIASGTARTL